MVEHFNRLFVSVDGRLRDLSRSESGQGFVEYTLLLLFVALGVFALVDWGTLKTAIGTALNNVANAIK
jgi:Flp pilus assembly pilin Flp